MLSMERVYLDRDNSIDVILMADGSAADLSSVTRMTLSFGDTDVDSAAAAGVFDWSVGGGLLTLQLGGQEIAVGRYDARLVVYDPGHSNGLVWGDIEIMVEGG